LELGKAPENFQDKVRCEASVEINHLVSGYLNRADEAARSCNVALALGDSKEYEEAERRLQDATEAFGEGNLDTLTGIDGLALMYKSEQQWTKAENLLLQVIQC
jgi:hypothetical protein